MSNDHPHRGSHAGKHLHSTDGERVGVTESPVKPRIGANEQEEGAPSRTVGRPLPSRPQVIRAIMRKDLAEYKRDRLWVILSALTLVMFIVVFWLLPSTVDETLTVGVHGGGLGQALEQGQGAGLGQREDASPACILCVDRGVLRTGLADSI